MGNRNADNGKKYEREACRELARLLGMADGAIVRRKNEGIPEDIGDLIGINGALPDLTIQVSGLRGTAKPYEIWARCRVKAAACTQQQQRRNTAHGVTLIRIGLGCWRAVLTNEQRLALGVQVALSEQTEITPGLVVRYGPSICDQWFREGDLYIGSLERWAADWKHRP